MARIVTFAEYGAPDVRKIEDVDRFNVDARAPHRF